jgi:hypothetical protein
MSFLLEVILRHTRIKTFLASTINPDSDMKKWFDDCTKQEPVLRPKANDLLSDISEKYSIVANQN